MLAIYEKLECMSDFVQFIQLDKLLSLNKLDYLHSHLQRTHTDLQGHV